MSDNHDHGLHSHGTETEGRLSPFLAKQRYKNAMKFFETGDKILDLGCGAGGFGAYLPDSVEYFGIDAQKHWDESDNLFVGMIGEKLPKALRGKKFDVITALAIIEHLDKPAELFKDSEKLLNDKGRIILTTPHPFGRRAHDFGAKIGLFSLHASEEHEVFLDKTDMEKLALDSGFKLLEYKRFLFGMNQVVVFEKA